MKLLSPTATLLPQASGLEGIYQQIERVGRICYKSEAKMTKDSAQPFVERMIKARHYAMLEHGTVYLRCPREGPDTEHTWMFKYAGRRYSMIQFHPSEGACITTNLRFMVEKEALDDLRHLCEPMEDHIKRLSVHFICDRAIANEFVRHRTFSFAQESTRYCNYSKDKFGNELSFIKPYWFKEEMNYGKGGLKDVNSQIFVESCELAEKNYLEMLELGKAKPQEARAILPLSLKTELVMTGFPSDWRHFFDLRLRGTTGAPHPDAKKVASMAHDAILQGTGMDL